MSLFHNNALIGASGSGGAYNISRSLRFNAADSAFLSRTPSVAGNRKTWTWAGWVKRSKLSGAIQKIFTAGTSGSSHTGIQVTASEQLEVFHLAGSFVFQLVTTQVLRDLSAWMHIAVAVDSTQATASNRVKLYVNGSQVTTFSTSSYPATQNADFEVNNTSFHAIAKSAITAGSNYVDGYLADIHFIDGQALTPTSFGEFSATTGVWMPKAYTGTYGTNGFRLTFADNSAATATTLGKDAAGSNNWTPNNLSVTAGVGNDSLIDVPLNGSQTDTGLGGQVRGNYATLNPLARVSNNAFPLSNGNLDATSPNDASYYNAIASIPFVAGSKFYCEVTCNTLAVAGDGYIGLWTVNSVNTGSFPAGANTGTYRGNGDITNLSGTNQTAGSSWTANDVIGVAVDVDAGTVRFYKNGVAQGANPSFSFTAGTSVYLRLGTDNSSGVTSFSCNFGQRPFAYAAPSGFKALCTANLPAPTIANPSTVMDVKLYTGDATYPRSITGLNFSPDLIWTKIRSQAYRHMLADSVRGTGRSLTSNNTDAESVNDAYGSVSAFNADGWSIQSGSVSGENFNQSGQSYVAWTWDADSSTVTNTAGSLTASVRANASAGFSIVTFNSGASGNKTVGHGLNVTPSFIILKDRNNTFNWFVFHSSVITATDQQLHLNAPNGILVGISPFWGAALPTSSVFGINSGSFGICAANSNVVAYCFAPVTGYSAFGSYTGNGSTDGPFVYTGFRPRWVMVKSTSYSDTDTDWNIIDTARGVNNVIGPYLNANNSAAEQTYSGWDLLSNGFKLRNTGNSLNRSGVTYLYVAFAETPFNFSRAR